MASNDLDEISFVGGTEQVQYYSRLDMFSLAAVIDTASNGFLDCPTTKRHMEGHKQGFLHGMPDEL